MANETEVEAQAATWLVRRDAGEPSLSQNEAFEAWLAADPRHRAAYLRLEAAWSRADRLSEWEFGGEGRLTASLGSADDAGEARAPPASFRSPTKAWVIAVPVALVLGIGIWFLLQYSNWEVYSTRVGGFQRVVLADGSAVELNSGSTLRVRLSAHRREILLSQGEANFTVAHDSARPFYVRAGDTTVRAIGTAFAVLLRDEEQIDVLVTEGRVSVKPSSPMDIAGTTAMLPTVVAGEIAVVGRDGAKINRLGALEMARRLAWTKRLVFTGQTLAEAVAEFNRYNSCRLVIADPAVAELQVGGTFSATDLDSFIVALDRTLHVRVSESESPLSIGRCTGGTQVTLIGAK